MSWARVCHRGEFEMILMTRARAATERLPMDDGAAFLGLILADDGDATPMGFLTLGDVRIFASRMEPRDISVFVAEGEDRGAIEAALTVPGVLH